VAVAFSNQGVPMTQDSPADREVRAVILVVEEQAAVRAFACEYLRDNGFQTLGVDTADGAIHLLEQGLAVDLVFCEIRTSGECDGHGLARWIAENRSGTPILLTGGGPGKDDAPSPVEILPKPYEMNRVLKRIRNAIEQHRPSPH
jgi:DNA-binding NtrC family response regulator